MFKKVYVLYILYIISIQVTAQTFTSEFLVRSTTSISGSSSNIFANNNEYLIQQSFGQTSSIGSFREQFYELRQGFIQPDILSELIDKSIPLSFNASVYPNPFIETISIHFKEKIEGNLYITIYDTLGKLLLNKQTPANTRVLLDLQNLPVAHYILKVRSANKQFINKIIKVQSE